MDISPYSPAAQNTRCVRHAMTPATHRCDKCGQPVCDRCVLPQPDGTTRCLCCTPPVISEAPPPLTNVAAPRILPTFEGRKCINHPEVNSTERCNGCGSYICATCDFPLSHQRHACPTCVMSEPAGIAPGRRNRAIIGCLLAVWGSVSLGLLMAGSFASMVSGPGGEAFAGILISLMSLLPAVAGYATSMCAIEKNLPNTPMLWVPVVWNGLIILGIIGLSIVGTFAM